MKNLNRKPVLLLIFILLTAPGLQSQTFTEQTAVTLPGVSSGSASWGDYDNDGDLDLLLSGIEADNTLLLKIFRNAGGTFTEVAGAFSPDPNNISSFGGLNYRAEWVDFDNDNLLDVIASGPAASSPGGGGCEVSVYRNTGSSFTRLYNSAYLTVWGGSSFYINNLSMNSGCSKWGDFDNDGDNDFVITGNSISKIYLNNGNNSFTE